MLRVTAVRDPDHGAVNPVMKGSQFSIFLSSRNIADEKLGLAATPLFLVQSLAPQRSPSEMNRRASFALAYRLQAGGSSSGARRREFPPSAAGWRCGIGIRESLRPARMECKCRAFVFCARPPEQIASRGIHCMVRGGSSQSPNKSENPRRKTAPARIRGLVGCNRLAQGIPVQPSVHLRGCDYLFA